MIGVIADVHGNLAALEAVLADMLAFDVDEILCLGDVADFGPEPAAAVARLRSLEPLTVMGNTDHYLLNPRSIEDVPAPDDDTPKYLEIEKWCASKLSGDDRDWLSTFAPYVELQLDGCRVVAYHGSPKRFNDPVLPDTDDAQLAEYFADLPADLYIGAHVHHQFARRHRRSVVANPGSVGMAFDRLPEGVRQTAVAEYLVLRVKDGQPNLHLRRVPYDTERHREAARRNGMPHADWAMQNLA